MKFVAYYRVSTRAQGNSGLGLEAQRTAVREFIRHNGNKIIAEFTEVESGRKSHRPELEKALQKCRDEDATLVIAKIDRLFRNVEATAKLMNSGIRFKCVDMPEANEFTIHVLAAMAEYESRLKSERLRAAFAEKRRREPNWKPGTPNIDDAARRKAWASTSAKAREATKDLFYYIKSLRNDGLSYQRIADRLNREGYRTRRGRRFFAQQVYNIYQRFNNQQ